MRKTFAIFVFLILLISCRSISTSTVAYNPNPQKVANPTITMKKIIEQQPPALVYMPNSVDVDDQCIKLGMTWTTPGPLGSPSTWTEYICYKNIGKISLSHNGYDKVWIVKINDMNNNLMYSVHSYHKSDAEQFIDAISNFVKPQQK